MIRFTDKIESIESKELSEKYKEIKPILKITDDEVKDYWKDVFSETKSTDNEYLDDELVSEIFERYESDFDFSNFDIDDSLQDKMVEFSSENWAGLDQTKKLEVMKDFISVLCEKLDVKNVPEIVLVDEDEIMCGLYNQRTNTLELNSNILSDSKETINTLAHEIRHAYQYQRVEVSETRMDKLYLYNFIGYIEPEEVDGHYLYFNEYENQLVEAEARAFAKIFSDFGGITYEQNY